MSASEVKRLMIQLKDVKEERNKCRDALMARPDITPTRLLTELQAAYDEGWTDAKWAPETAASEESWEESWVFKGFLEEFRDE